MESIKLMFDTDNAFGVERMSYGCARKFQLQTRQAACNALNASGDMGWSPDCVASTGELLGELASRDLLCLV